MCFYDEINGIEDIDFLFSLSLSFSHPSQRNRMRRKIVVGKEERKLLMYSKINLFYLFDTNK